MEVPSIPCFIFEQFDDRGMTQKNKCFSMKIGCAALCIGICAPLSFARAESQSNVPVFPAVIPFEIQKGIIVPPPITTILQNIFQAQPPVRLPQSSVPVSPQLESGLKSVRQGVQSVIRFDSALQRLNGEIKQKLGINVPVLAQAIWDGIVWVVRAIAGLVMQLIPRQ
jgi:hypothetical protein